MGQVADRATLIWSLTNSGIGTTITTSGNSGGYSSATPNARTAVDLRYGWADDVEIMVYVAGKTYTPTLMVGLGVYDDQGNLYQPTALQLTPILTSVPIGSLLAAGRHAGTAGTYISLPEWGQIYWTCSGGTCTGVEIALYGR